MLSTTEITERFEFNESTPKVCYTYFSPDHLEIFNELYDDVIIEVINSLGSNLYIDFLYLLNEIERIIYDKTDRSPRLRNVRGKYRFRKCLQDQVGEYFKSENLETYARTNIKERVVFNFAGYELNVAPISFAENWEYGVNLRRSAGVILMNNNDEILMVYDRYRCLNFPMGKEDHKDCNNLKSVALRECFEEVGYKWPIDTVNQLSMYATSYCAVNSSWDCIYEGKIQRFYFFPGFLGQIRRDFRRKNEIQGNLWIHINKLQSFFNEVDLDKTYEKTERIKFKFEDRIKTLCVEETNYTVAFSVHNFFTRKTVIRDHILDPNNPFNIPLDNAPHDRSEAAEALRILFNIE